MIAFMKKRPFSGEPAAILLIAFAVLCLSAAPPAAPDDFIRLGNQASERGAFDEALRLYQQAEERGIDPGLIAFNKATAYYQLQDYRQAENHFRMALDDAAIPSERRTKALYDLGNCLVRQADAKDHETLRSAIRCYELCLDAAPEDALRSDAAHNLEVAKLLWNKARSQLAKQLPPNEGDPPDNHKPPEPKKKDRGSKEGDGNPANSGKDKVGVLPKEVKQLDGKDNGKEDLKKAEPAPKPGPSRVPVVPDTDELTPMTSEDTQRALEAAERRLREGRLRNRESTAVPEDANGRDW